jgi:membrane protease YdiL (CAAX protease family)
VATLLFGCIAIASLAGPTFRERARLHPAVVVVAGCAAVALAVLGGGAPPPLPPAPLATVGLDVLAAVAEEAFFRRFLYDRALRYGPAVAAGVCALLFAAIHVPVYGPSVFWVDLGAGLLFGWQRWASGTWAAPAATHAFANLLVNLR